MHAVRLYAEGVGPFEKLDLDLSDGQGKPHLGPHILVGVNGSGKSTALRAMAWALGGGMQGFPQDEWRHALAGRTESAAILLGADRTDGPWAVGCAYSRLDLPQAKSLYHAKVKWLGIEPESVRIYDALPRMPRSKYAPWRPYRILSKRRLTLGTIGLPMGQPGPPAVAYSPVPVLSYLPHPALNSSVADLNESALSFERTVSNEVVQNWLLNLFSRSAIAEKRGDASDAYADSLLRFETALREIFQEDIHLDVDLEPEFQLFLKVRNQRLNFSQLPDGIRTVLGWLADFMMRQERERRWAPGSPSILLIDEIDAHLHPRWQRQILPAIKQALPEVQIIVSTHSPFIVNSCAGARVHVLEVNERGQAHALPPTDAPFGQSFNAALKDVFQVESRFDLRTERDLQEWNALSRKKAAKKISSEEAKRLAELSGILASRSEELRFMVSIPPMRIAPSAVRPSKKTKNGTARPGR